MTCLWLLTIVLSIQLSNSVENKHVCNSMRIGASKFFLFSYVIICLYYSQLPIYKYFIILNTYMALDNIKSFVIVYIYTSSNSQVHNLCGIKIWLASMILISTLSHVCLKLAKWQLNIESPSFAAPSGHVTIIPTKFKRTKQLAILCTSNRTLSVMQRVN